MKYSRTAKTMMGKGLTDRQKETMKRHSKHHSKKHMDMMTEKMLNGMSFGNAHKLAQKKVGT
tara:strand:- start:38 stop:223 length:186 start_codon:yes stop_codon:yes gene_type:complete